MIFSQLLRSVALAGCAALLLSGVARAQQTPPPPDPVKTDFSQKVSDGLAKFKELIDGNNTPKAIEYLDELLKMGNQGDSFDQAQLNLYKGNLLLPSDDPRVAIPPLEHVLDIASRLPLTNLRRDIVQIHLNLSKVYYWAVQNKSATDAERSDAINKSIQHLETYFKAVGEPTADESYQYASFLFTRATMGRDADNPDLATIKQAREVAQKGILRDPRFRTDLYTLVLTALQYEKNTEGTAEIMELLLDRNPAAPENVRFWQLLPRLYLALANDMAEKHDEDRANEYRFRAILAYERGQQKAGLYSGANGQDATMDILNLSKTFFDVGQIEKGADVLLEALRAKKINDTMNARVWLFASTYFTQLGKMDRTIAVLKEAAGNFPQDGQFDLQLSQAYYSIEQLESALASVREAIRKGVPGKEASMRLSEAYYLYSLNRFSEASQSAAKGLALPNVPAADAGKLKQIKDASDTAEASREAAKNR